MPGAIARHVPLSTTKERAESSNAYAAWRHEMQRGKAGYEAKTAVWITGDL